MGESVEGELVDPARDELVMKHFILGTPDPQVRKELGMAQAELEAARRRVKKTLLSQDPEEVQVERLRSVERSKMRSRELTSLKDKFQNQIPPIVDYLPNLLRMEQMEEAYRIKLLEDSFPPPPPEDTKPTQSALGEVLRQGLMLMSSGNGKGSTEKKALPASVQRQAYKHMDLRSEVLGDD